MTGDTRRIGPFFSSLAGYRASWLASDAKAGLLLAAIALPEQFATARLAGLPPVAGLLAFAAGTLAFAAFGRHRLMSVGADSTIAPIIAGTLSALAVAGSAQYASFAAVLGVLVGVILMSSHRFHLGWVADLLSIPVTTGLLAGVACHIVVGQVPTVLGLQMSPGSLPATAAAIAGQLGETQIVPLLIAGCVLAITLLVHATDRQIPGPLIGLTASGVAVWWFGLKAGGLDTLGDLTISPPSFSLAIPNLSDFATLLPLALVVSLLCMIQTSSVIQAFGGHDADPETVSRDFAAIGAGNLLAGLIGAFPVNSSPPRTGIVAEAGGLTQLSGLLAILVCGLVVAFGSTAFSYVPQAALSGVLLFVAIRIIRVATIRRIWRQSPVEAGLVFGSAALVVFLPIGVGVGLGIVLSLMHSLYTIARPNCRELFRVEGTTIWWADMPDARGERVPGVLAFSLGAPLNFLSTKFILGQLTRAIEGMPDPCKLVVLEGNSVVDIDFTGAELLRERIEMLRGSGITVALARLELVRAIGAARHTGLIESLGPDHVFRSVEEAVRALGPQ